jgi:hypothetical protein
MTLPEIMAESGKKIIGSVLALMKKADRISVIVEVERGLEGAMAAAMKSLTEMGILFIETDHYIFCDLTPEQIRTVAEFKEVRHIWHDCPVGPCD